MGTLTRAEFVLQGVCTKIRKKFSDEIELFVKKKKKRMQNDTANYIALEKKNPVRNWMPCILE